MRNFTLRSRQLTAVVAVSVACVILGSQGQQGPDVASAQEAKHVAKGQPHSDLFRTARPKETPIFDPRLKVDRILYSPIGDRVIVEGDIDFGTLEEVQKTAAEHAAGLASRILDDPAIRALPQEQQDALRKIAGMSKGTDEAAARRAEAAKVIDTVTRLKADTAYGKVGREIVKDLRAASGQEGEERAPSNDPGDVPQRSVAIVEGPLRQFRWPNGVIPYVISGSCPDPQVVRDAISHWHAKTDRIRLVERNSTNEGRYAKNWVRFVGGDGCSSRVGKKPTPGPQDINLAAGCFVPQVVHEIGHAAGLFHEQSRNDRDRFLIIQATHIDQDTLHNFDLVLQTGIDIGPFDFKSIMLYPARSFTSDGQPTMLRRDNPTDVTSWGIDTGGLGGSSRELSPGDLAGVEFMYPSPADENASQ